MVDQLDTFAFDGATSEGELRRPYELAVAEHDPFWSAVHLVRQPPTSRRGAGRAIAVVDGGFDETDPALTGGAHAPGFETPIGFVSPHGTDVALLIQQVAPDADYTFYSVADPKTNKISVERYQKAMQTIGDSDHDIVNVSMGFARDLNTSLEVHAGQNPSPFDPYVAAASDNHAYSCGLCPPAESVAAGAFVVAAAGQAREAIEGWDLRYFCPARSSAVMAVGFIADDRTVHGQGAETHATAAVGRPSYPQSFSFAYGLLQPAGLMGSSYASPLFAGALALVDDLKLAPDYVALEMRGSLASAIMEQSGLETAEDQQVLAEVEKALQEVVDAFSHSHTQGEGPCFECGLFLQSSITNLGVLQLWREDLAAAHASLSRGVEFAPWSADLNANLGQVLYRAALENPAERDQYLAAALAWYEEANKLRPGPLFRNWIVEVKKSMTAPT